jgi:HAD superfamily hydrolase (TIGR01509 family)
MSPALIIFDCDGVLVDTEPVSNEVMSACLGRYGYQISAEECRLRFVGRTIEAVQTEVEMEVGRSFGRVWATLVRSETEAAFDLGVAPIPGVEDAIRLIMGADLKYCVASSGRFSKMRKSLGMSGLLQYFENVLFSAEQVAHGKPAPDLFLFAADRMQVAPSESLVIEDSVPGVEAGFAAGMQVLAYAGDPKSDKAGLTRTGATTFLDMGELPALLGLRPSVGADAAG